MQIYIIYLNYPTFTYFNLSRPEKVDSCRSQLFQDETRFRGRRRFCSGKIGDYPNFYCTFVVLSIKALKLRRH